MALIGDTARIVAVVSTCFESVTLKADRTLFDNAGWTNAATGEFTETSKCLAKGSETWVVQKIPWGPMPHTLDGWMMLRAMDDKGQDLGWIQEHDSIPYRHCIVRSTKFEDMPSEVRSAVIQLYLDQDGRSKWEALFASRGLLEIRDMNLSETRKLFTEHGMQRSEKCIRYQDRDSYLQEVEIMAASGVGSKAIQLQCARSEEGVSVTLVALSGEELANLTLSTSEKTVGALREAVRDALADVVKSPLRIVLHDRRMLADFDHTETIATVFDQ
jgi:hypothetical protein